MKRRSFIGVAAGASTLLAGGGCRPETKSAKGAAPAAAGAGAGEYRLAGKTLDELIAQYRGYLFDDFLPFLDRFVIDREQGGLLCNTDIHGKLLSTDKTTWYQGRGLWLLSYLYNHLDQNPKWLEAGRRTAEALARAVPEGDAFFPASYDRDWKPKTPPPPNFYGDMFVVLGLQEYARAAGDEGFRKLAKDIMMKCVRVYDRPDYWPGAAQSYLGPKAPLMPGARIGGHWFMLLNSATLMLATAPDAEILQVTDRALDAILNGHLRSDLGLLNEVVNHDLSRPDNDVAQFVYPGHSTETLWMSMHEAARRGDAALFGRFAALLRRNLEVSWDDVYGGFLMGLNHVDRNEWNLRKSNWTQGEAVIGCLTVLEHTGDAWAAEWFGKTFAYLTENFPLKAQGSPLWIDYSERKIAYDPKNHERTEVLHHPRHLMYAILALERMKKNGGVGSGLRAGA